MAARLTPLHICRGLIREVSKASRKGIKSEQHDFIMKKYRANQPTSARHCRALEEANHDAATYWCLLRSTQELDDMIVKYRGVGERTPEQTANLVGLQVPGDYTRQDASDEDTNK